MIPLAWRNLIHQKRRLALSLAGIGFVVLLMFMETGFNHGALDTQLIVYQSFRADLVMVSTARTPDYPDQFARDRLVLVRAHTAVAEAIPLYVRPAGAWKVPGTGAVRPIRVIGFDAHAPAIRNLPAEDRLLLQRPGTVLFDRYHRDVFGPVQPGMRVEVGGRRVEVAGFFSMGVDLESDGTLLTDDSTFFAIFADADGEVGPRSVDYGLIQLKPGTDAAQALAEIRLGLSEDVKVLPLTDYVASVKAYWQDSTPMGFLFSLGVLVGLVIGVIVCYQVLFTDISANLMPFATLKGMGYHNSYLVKVVFQQAAILALLGFACGLAGAAALYRFLHWSTGLVMLLTVPRAAVILALTLGMCLMAALMAVGKVIKADPADCF